MLSGLIADLPNQALFYDSRASPFPPDFSPGTASLHDLSIAQLIIPNSYVLIISSLS